LSRPHAVVVQLPNLLRAMTRGLRIVAVAVLAPRLPRGPLVVVVVAVPPVLRALHVPDALELTVPLRLAILTGRILRCPTLMLATLSLESLRALSLPLEAA